MSDHFFETTDKNRIIEFLNEKSLSMSEYIKDHISSEYLLIYKYITHSDLPNRGKRNGNAESIEKNFLYYLSFEQMHMLENIQDKPFESAKQSNIGISSKFFSAIGMEQLQRRAGPQYTQHKHEKINDYADVYLVNDTMNYFSGVYTRNILNKLGKTPSWFNEDINVKLLESSEFTPIQISQAIHGLGVADDVEFSKLRLNIFKNDVLIILVESSISYKKNVFIMLEKNPVFFTLIGETNLSWQKYVEKQNAIKEFLLSGNDIIDIDNDSEKNRKQQAKWRNLLAAEMMNYSTTEGEVFCPFTYLTCNYDELGTLFRASHIKAFNDCDNISEAFDINNGLLLCANADALFDKYLITISEEKELIVSFLLKENQKLLNNLLLNQPIFKTILNEKRMEYIDIHRKKFYEEEEKRKKI